MYIIILGDRAHEGEEFIVCIKITSIDIQKKKIICLINFTIVSTSRPIFVCLVLLSHAALECSSC